MKNFTVSIILIGHIILLIGCKEEHINVPAITSFSPTAAQVGSEITVSGTNFSRNAADMIVKINGVECPIISVSFNEIKTKAVLGVTTGKISVTIGNFAAVSFNDFTLKQQTITSISPSSGVVGDEITITGSNYGNEVNDVKLFFYDSIPSDIYDFQSVGETDTIKVFKTKVPANATTGPLTVVIDKTSVESQTDFTVNP